MSSSYLSSLLLVLMLLGCDRSQPWTFRNGPSLMGGEPPTIRAEVYVGDCGACAPMGSRPYCERIAPGESGPQPTGLTEGQRYCFVGTALDAAGVAYGIGCVAETIGGGPIEITLAPIEPDTVIARVCSPPVVEFDAGPAFDAGPGMDAGVVVGVDAGPPLPDAGPPMDGGLSFGDPVTVRFIPRGPGAVYLRELPSRNDIGLPQPIREGRIRTLRGYVGYALEIDVEPDMGAVYLGIPGCGTSDPCSIQLDRSEDIVIPFATSGM